MYDKDYWKKYREENREKIREYDRQWKKDNRDKVNESARKYRENHPEKIKEITKRCYENNREERLAKMRRYNGQNESGLNYVNFIMDVTNDKRLMPLFEDILYDREIAEIEIKIKYFDRNDED